MYAKKTTAALSLAALAASASAQNIPGISDLSTQCQAAATSLISSDFSNCANLLGLVQVFTASGSIVTPINNWLGGVCPATCSDSAISSARQTVTSGCQSDISSGNTVAIGLSSVVTNFKDYQSAFCLQSTSNSSYCVTNLLSSIQNSTGQSVSLDYLQNILTGNILTSLDQNLPAGVVCTDCTHALTTKLKPILVETTNQTAANTAEQAVASRCGSSFTDGQIPSTVKEGAAAAASSGSSSGGGSGSGSGAGNVIVAPVLGLVGMLLGAIVVLA